MLLLDSHGNLKSEATVDQFRTDEWGGIDRSVSGINGVIVMVHLIGQASVLQVRNDTLHLVARHKVGHGGKFTAASTWLSDREMMLGVHEGGWGLARLELVFK